MVYFIAGDVRLVRPMSPARHKPDIAARQHPTNTARLWSIHHLLRKRRYQAAFSRHATYPSWHMQRWDQSPTPELVCILRACFPPCPAALVAAFNPPSDAPCPPTGSPGRSPKPRCFKICHGGPGRDSNDPSPGSCSYPSPVWPVCLGSGLVEAPARRKTAQITLSSYTAGTYDQPPGPVVGYYCN